MIQKFLFSILITFGSSSLVSGMDMMQAMLHDGLNEHLGQSGVIQYTTRLPHKDVNVTSESMQQIISYIMNCAGYRSFLRHHGLEEHRSRQHTYGEIVTLSNDGHTQRMTGTMRIWLPESNVRHCFNIRFYLNVTKVNTLFSRHTFDLNIKLEKPEYLKQTIR